MYISYVTGIKPRFPFGLVINLLVVHIYLLSKLHPMKMFVD